MKYLFLILGLGIFLIPATSFAQVSGGDLIKCPENSAVYYYGDDGTRHLFQNEKTFNSWEKDFSRVQTIACDDMSQIEMGEIVPYQSGTRLVKARTVSKVYAIESDRVLRPLKNEQQAINLYGKQWATRVDDISEAFLPQYTIAEELTEGELPEGMILKNDTGTIFRVDADGAAVKANAIIGDPFVSKLDDNTVAFEELQTTFIEKYNETIKLIQEDDPDFVTRTKTIEEKHAFVVIPEQDRIEVREFIPLDVPPAEPLIEGEIDTDGDGVTNKEEIEIYHTDPFNPDSDNDGFFDGLEVNRGFDPNGFGALPTGIELLTREIPTAETVEEVSMRPGTVTEPIDHMLSEEDIFRDSDNDGLSDVEELEIYLTDPNNNDSDNDGFIDGTEVRNGFDPLGEGLISDELADHEPIVEEEPEPTLDSEPEEEQEPDPIVDAEPSTNPEPTESDPATVPGQFNTPGSEQGANLVLLESGTSFFTPNIIVASPGEQITINFLRNTGTHSFVIDALGINTTIIEGQSFTIIAPSTTGEFVFYSDVGSDRASGMEGLFIVQ